MLWTKALIKRVANKFALKSTPRPSNPEPPAEEHQTERDIFEEGLVRRLNSCYKELETNEWYLDHRHEYLAKDREAWQARNEAGDPENETLQQIEQRQFRQTQELMRLVIEAEGEVEKAEAAVAEAGVDILSAEYGSKCGDDDGYKISELNESCQSGEDDYVDKWLKDVPHSRQGDEHLLPAFDPPRQPLEIDAWYAPEPEIWESGSTLTEDCERRKIDRWGRQVAAIAQG